MKVLVTGGGGFLGSAICRQLVARGDEVVSVARGDYPALAAAGVDTRRGDIAEPDVVHDAARGCDAVFHVAAKAGVWGPYESFRRVNVVGTDNVIAACTEFGIGRLVHTSTPSVVHAGDDIGGVDESAPYAEQFLTHYPETKAEAERRVLAANGPDLATVALRPHLIWGPGDAHFLPRILDRARRGRLALVGDGSNPVDTVYIDNAADAHVAALDRLGPGAACAGRAYFITNDDPRPVSEIINGILGAADLPPVTRSVSPSVAYAVGATLEVVYRLFGVTAEPPMTRFVARQLSTAHWYDIGAARRDLGYAPRVSVDEGFARLRTWLAEESADG